MADDRYRIAERALKTGLVSPEEVVEWVGWERLQAAKCRPLLEAGLCPSCGEGEAYGSAESESALCWCCGDCDYDERKLDTCPVCAPLYAAGVRRGR